MITASQVRRSLTVLRILGAITILVSCTSRRGGPPPVVNIPKTATVPAVAPTSVALHLDTSQTRYRIESHTVVLAGSDTTSPLDSISVIAQVVAAARWKSNRVIEVRGEVQQLSATSGIAPNRVTNTLKNPITLVWEITGDSTVVVAPSASSDGSCADLDQTARELLVALMPSLPDSVIRDQVWAANIGTSTCRAGVSLQVQSSSQNRVLNFAEAIGGMPLRVESALTTSIQGSGRQGATAMTLRGSGTGVTLYSLDLSRGLHSSESTAEMQLEFDLGYRTDRFIQRTTRKVSRL